MTKEKLDIGRRVYERQLTAKEAAEENGVTLQTVYLYAREYMKSIGVEPLPKGTKRAEPSADYRSMTREELINELMLKDIEVGVLQMEGPPVESAGKAWEEDGRRRAVPRVPFQAPEPRLSLAERQDEARSGLGGVRPIRPQMPQVRRDQIGKQAPRLQKAGGSPRGSSPTPRDGLGRRRRPPSARH